MKLLRWLLWSCYYLPQRCRYGRDWNSLDAYLLRTERTRWPWKKFRPNLSRSTLGNRWDVWLKGDPSYTARRILDLEVMISEETGEIIGLKLWDSDLEPKAARRRVMA